MKWQPTEWEKIFANYISYNGLVLKNIFKLYNSIKKQSSLKMGTGNEHLFLQRKYTINRHTKKMLRVTNIREMQ